ncbi:MAG: GntR family transcriptional regulator [Bacillaceae bacterium]|jgi:GntR family transcriptional regulator|uniref:GntR family transcriptional regulator n=2 Tax=Aeribacillus TaxID=1055323 RepID=A0A163YH65_9BACI|nr:MULTISPECIES: GntR family transcriptional regulator [Aeribacillus]REJ12394.1 MAG: GntR family transcriptional regulator [Bacillaceae bacterium]KZM53648.1 GntR family transcriptional regulator [Aeribacillus pallidus]KZN94965.1 GntR family transcriptional regulator [Aeribacillus pallidus]MDR9793434.1 GntR family transcriptional regulator [Aeribacillus pallidus]MDR9796247.1 GntR family transcriptional regulator [Aeribacillus pallidus]
MLDIDFRSRKPIYEQLVDQIKEMIVSGVLKGGEQLPSVRVLAQQLTVNPNTIQKAYRELERIGYIYSIQGKGNFVSEKIEASNQEELKMVKENLQKLAQQALFLGMQSDELLQIMEEIIKDHQGGKRDD